MLNRFQVEKVIPVLNIFFNNLHFMILSEYKKSRQCKLPALYLLSGFL